jgi:hypothetical protein
MEVDAMDPYREPLPTAECPQCGEAMEMARRDDAAEQAIFHCSNGHTVVVELVEEYEEDEPTGYRRART